MRVLVVLMILGACSPATTRRIGHVTAGFAVAATACDYGSTRGTTFVDTSRTIYGPNGPRAFVAHRETNPILGPAPSHERTDAYFAIVTVGMLAAGYALPAKWRPYFFGAIGAFELEMARENLASASPCGL